MIQPYMVDIGRWFITAVSGWHTEYMKRNWKHLWGIFNLAN